MNFKPWLTFTKERLPLLSYALLVGGFTLTGKALTQGNWGWEFWLSFIGLMIFFIELRLMDEFKDYKKDLIAHPQRPLPRGLIKPESLQKVISWGLMFMLTYGVSLCLLSNEAGISYILILFYLYLMYKEFFLGEGFANSPLLYAASHQIIIVGLTVFATACFNAMAVYDPVVYLAGFVVLGCFFTYEVCRKMDPQAHPLLKTYLQVYGTKKVGLLLCILQLISWTAAFLLHQQISLFGLIAGSALLLLSWILFVMDEKKFKAVEGAGTFTLLISLYIIPLQFWITGG